MPSQVAVGAGVAWIWGATTSRWRAPSDCGGALGSTGRSTTVLSLLISNPSVRVGITMASCVKSRTGAEAPARSARPEYGPVTSLAAAAPEMAIDRPRASRVRQRFIGFLLDRARNCAPILPQGERRGAHKRER